MSFGFTGKVSVASVFLLFGTWCAVTLFPVGLDKYRESLKLMVVSRTIANVR